MAFFQLEMQGGIFHACWSFTVTLRGGECMTGTGGEGGPAGTFLCLNLGGSMGSTGISTMRMMRCLAVVCPMALSLGVYWMYLSLEVVVEAEVGTWTGRAAAILPLIIISRDALLQGGLGGGEGGIHNHAQEHTSRQAPPHTCARRAGAGRTPGTHVRAAVAASSSSVGRARDS